MLMTIVFEELSVKMSIYANYLVTDDDLLERKALEMKIYHLNLFSAVFMAGGYKEMF